MGDEGVISFDMGANDFMFLFDQTDVDRPDGSYLYILGIYRKLKISLFLS